MNYGGRLENFEGVWMRNSQPRQPGLELGSSAVLGHYSWAAQNFADGRVSHPNPFKILESNSVVHHCEEQSRVWYSNFPHDRTSSWPGWELSSLIRTNVQEDKKKLKSLYWRILSTMLSKVWYTHQNHPPSCPVTKEPRRNRAGLDILNA